MKESYTQTSAAPQSSELGWLLQFIYLSVNSLEIITSDIFLILSLSCSIFPCISCLPLAANTQPPVAPAGASHLPPWLQDQCQCRWGRTSLPAPLSPGWGLLPGAQRVLQPDTHWVSHNIHYSHPVTLRTRHSAFWSIWRKGKGFDKFGVRAPVVLLGITARLNASVELVHYYSRTK